MEYPKIKLVTRDTDFKEAQKKPWDTYCNGLYYDVYMIPDHFHSIGGKWGNNNLWACERDKEPSYQNLFEFSGFTCSWSFKFKESNYTRYKYNYPEILNSIGVYIERNDKEFYHFVVNNIDYGIAKARLLLFKIKEHPISFNDRNFENEIVGRKILFRDRPSIIESYHSGSVIIVADGWDIKEYRHYDGDPYIKDDVFSPSISWFR